MRETLAAVAMADTQFLADFISIAEIEPLIRAVALHRLELACDDTFIDFLKAFTKHESPLVCEGAFLGLAEYYFDDETTHADLFLFFQKALKSELGEGVQKQILNLLKAMEMYRE